MVAELPNNITGIVSFFDYVVSVEPMFWTVMLFVLWVILVAAFVRFGASRSLVTSSLIVFIISIPIAVLDWMDVKWVYLFALFLAGSIFWRSLESGQGE